MQLQSTLSRLAAFALFLVSFSMLACAAPAPVGALAAPVSLAARDNSLVARGDVSDQCHQALVDLEAKVDVHVAALGNCYNTPNCDCKPIIANIVADIQVAIDIIVKLVGTISVKLDLIANVIISIIIKIATACKPWVVKLGVGIMVELNLALKALIQVCLDICVSVVIKDLLTANIKLGLTAYVQLCLSLGLNLVLKVLGLIGI